MAVLVVHPLRGERVAQSMLTGKQYPPAEGKEPHERVARVDQTD